MSEIKFSFGKNWNDFVKTYLDNERIKEAIHSLQKFTGLKNFKGKTFIDIGCGSGLFSYAAYQLGAKEILSFDIDKNSVECCRLFHKYANSPNNWKVKHGSILDKNFLRQINKYDIVYAWGVLHHTGDMYSALKNAIGLVKNNGFLYIAIYNKAEGIGIWSDGRIGSSKFWVKVKRIYSSLPDFAQNLILYVVMCFLILIYILCLKNPVRVIKSHRKYRGMAWKIDIKDWLGGYPYEYASPEEIFKFCQQEGLILQNLKTSFSLMNNEYLFQKPAK